MAKVAQPFNPLQIETIINKVVPLIAAPEDHEFFRGVLFVKAENSTSGQFSLFVNKLMKQAA
jgi:hypothetical protein